MAARRAPGVRSSATSTRRGELRESRGRVYGPAAAARCFGIIVLGTLTARAPVSRPRLLRSPPGQGLYDHDDDRRLPGKRALPGASGPVEAGTVWHDGAGHYQFTLP